MADFFWRDVHCVLGLPFDVVDLPGAVARVRRAMVEGQPCFFSTPNLNFLIAAQSDPDFRDSVIESDMSIADGMPLVWIARLLGIPLPERVAGSSVFEQLAADKTSVASVYFFGGQEGVAAAACGRLNDMASGLRCVGFEYPGFGSIDEMSSVESIGRINASGADFVVVSLGAKKGQAWIRRNRQFLTAPVISHLGAVVNFVAGALTRAPALVQRLGLEWLWRIKEEPALSRRYFYDGMAFLHLFIARVLPLVWHQWLNRPRLDDLARSAVRTIRSTDTTTVVLAGAWGASNLAPLRACLAEVVDGSHLIHLDLEQVTHVDSAFIGLLMLLHGVQLAPGRQLTVTRAKPVVSRTFRFACADFLFHSR